MKDCEIYAQPVLMFLVQIKTNKRYAGSSNWTVQVWSQALLAYLLIEGLLRAYMRSRDKVLSWIQFSACSCRKLLKV